MHHFASHSATVGTGLDKTWCASNTVSGGSNRMLAAVAQLPTYMQIYNAEELNNYMLLVNNATARTATITVTDMYGRVLYTQNAALQDGENRIPVNLNGMGLSSGMYVIRAVAGKTAQSKKINVIK